MRALVTGIAGFIGSTLAFRLKREGWDVVGIDSFTDYYDVNLKRRNANLLGNSGVEIIDGDLNSIDLAPLATEVDAVFHQAGQPGVRASWGEGFDHYVDRNVRATQRLLEALKDQPRLSRLVYASSSSVYGDAKSFPTSEETIPTPVSPYGVTKLAAEHLVTLYGLNFGVPTTSLRYFTVFGPGQRPDMAFTRFVMAAAKGTSIDVFGNGNQIRDFTYVDDVVQANILAATTASRPGAVYNVAGGTSVSINQVLATLGRIRGASLAVDYKPRASGDVFRTGGSTVSIERELGWRPSVGLEEGLERQYAWASDLHHDLA